MLKDTLIVYFPNFKLPRTNHEVILILEKTSQKSILKSLCSFVHWINGLIRG